MIHTTHFAEPWPVGRLREARAILADVVHHPETLVVLAARVVIAHSPDVAECRDARALRQILEPGLFAVACPQGGAA